MKVYVVMASRLDDGGEPISAWVRERDAIVEVERMERTRDAVYEYYEYEELELNTPDPRGQQI